MKTRARHFVTATALGFALLIPAFTTQAATIFNADFDNPGGVGLGPDAASMVFAGHTNASPTPTNPDGFLVLGGSGSGGIVFDSPAPILFDGITPLVISTSGSYVGGTNDGANSYMGLVALHQFGTSSTGDDRRGGMFAQFRSVSDGSGLMRLGYQTDSTANTGDGFTAAFATAIPALSIADPDGVFDLSLTMDGLDDTDALVFNVTQGVFSASINTTILGYRNSLAGAQQTAFDLVLSELRADPTLMNIGYVSTSSIAEQFDFLNVQGAVPPVPEPSTLTLLGLGALGLVSRTRRRRRRA